MTNNHRLLVEVVGDLDEDIEDDLAERAALNSVVGDFRDTISQHLFE